MKKLLLILISLSSIQGVAADYFSDDGCHVRINGYYLEVLHKRKKARRFKKVKGKREFFIQVDAQDKNRAGHIVMASTGRRNKKAYFHYDLLFKNGKLIQLNEWRYNMIGKNEWKNDRKCLFFND